jgi:glycosyltransferase involved in cell wall biosynthesis
MSRLAVRLARQHRLPLVYSFHTMLTEYAHYVPLLRNAAERCLARTFLGHCAEADYVTAPTAVAREFLLEQGVKARVAVVPTAVPPLQPTPGSRERVRRELGVGRDTPLLLYAARLSKEKQLDFLVRAVARLEPSHQFRLCLAGGRPVQRELRRLAARLGITESVTFCGWIPHEQMPDYYAAADVFVFPSTSDTLGVALVEAMGVGLPCVAVDRYGPGEVVMDGESGLLVPFDEAAFATAVGRLLRDQALRHRIAEAARRRARDFAPEPVTDRLCAVYREAALSHRFASAGAIGTAPRRSRGWWKCASWS